jgi:hypothetical protein
MKFSFIKWLCSETKLPESYVDLFIKNSVHDDNVECLNWQDFRDMGIPVAPAK